jgi:hypothetical protein
MTRRDSAGATSPAGNVAGPCATWDGPSLGDCRLRGSPARPLGPDARILRVLWGSRCSAHCSPRAWRRSAARPLREFPNADPRPRRRAARGTSQPRRPVAPARGAGNGESVAASAPRRLPAAELTRLHELRGVGAITDAEFNRAKQIALDPDAGVSTGNPPGPRRGTERGEIEHSTALAADHRKRRMPAAPACRQAWAGLRRHSDRAASVDGCPLCGEKAVSAVVADDIDRLRARVALRCAGCKTWRRAVVTVWAFEGSRQRLDGEREALAGALARLEHERMVAATHAFPTSLRRDLVDPVDFTAGRSFTTEDGR